MKLFEVEVISINRSSTWEKLDQIIAHENNITYQSISLGKRPFWTWAISSLIWKLSKIIVLFIPNHLRFNAYASSKSSYLLDGKLRKYNNKYELIIAHSYGALYPSYQFSSKRRIPFIFDIEDYHPGEAVADGTQNEVKRREFLLKKTLPKAGFITYASPLIGEYSLKLISDYPKENSALINNCFSASDFSYKENNSEKMSFVWFSQNITAARGLEIIVPYLYSYRQQVHLTLIGNLYQNFYDNFLGAYREVLTILPPVSQTELHDQLANFDIGLALELKNSDINKNIALSNKIFAYAQSGLFILASDTDAQKIFMEENPSLGVVVNLSENSLVDSIKYLLNNIKEIRYLKRQRFEYAKSLSWDNESQKLVEIWEKIL